MPGFFMGPSWRVVSPSEAVINLNLREQTAEVLKTLSPREEKIIKMRFGLQDGSEVLEHAVGLRAHITGDDLRGGGIDGDLSGSKDQALGSNGLRVGSDGLRGLLGGDHFAHDSSSAAFLKMNGEKRLTQIAAVEVKRGLRLL